MVVGLGPAELVDLGGQELGGLQNAAPLKMNVSLNDAVDGAFGRRAVVADDVVDERVVEHSEIVDRVESRPTWWSVCARNAAYTSIWRARTGFSSSGMSSHAGISVGPRRQLGVGGDHAERLLAGEDLVAKRIPPASKRPR